MTHEKERLAQDLVEVMAKVSERGYIITPSDIFALGYMCAKYDVKRLIDNQEEVIEACRKYDETDDLALLDTIGETLIDLEVIVNDGRI